MSEPTGRAVAAREWVTDLLHYGMEDDRIDDRSESFVARTAAGAVLVDPLPMEGALLERLGPIAAIVVQVSSHQRSAWRLRRETGAPVFVPRASLRLEEEGDETYGDGERLPGGFLARHSPGPQRAHFVLEHPAGGGTLLLGDLVIRDVRDPGGGLILIPETHRDDPAALLRSLRRLLEGWFEAAGFGHGEPMPRGARGALRDLLAREEGGRR